MEMWGRKPHSIWMVVCFTLPLFASAVHSFYLPGVAPQDCEKGDLLKVKVNKLASVKTQLPYAYYSIPYYKPKEIVDPVLRKKRMLVTLSIMRRAAAGAAWSFCRGLPPVLGGCVKCANPS
ncbi:Endomembrane protein 70 protein family [Perilla frutescens var. hirtella]|nr:Endomembrane protein 70 protein family [Perilla frutescens var. frutescens]KAH6783608.1 Endomembrane protein 70 protein family [Perilla frutescens var. hirtella]